MELLLWLLLPVAAASGWASARASTRRQCRKDDLPAHQMSQQCIQGLNYLLSDQSDKAIEMFVGLVEVDEDTVETHLILGSLFRNRGEVDRAIRIHQNIIARPNLSTTQKSQALLELGIDYFKAGLLDRAENIFLQLSETGSKNPKLFEYLCRLYEQERDWEKAIQSARNLIKLDRKKHETRVAHYYCQQAEELIATKPDQALACTKSALSLDPGCVRALILQGDIYQSRHKPKDALKSYRIALSRNKFFSPIVLHRVFNLYKSAARLEQFPQFVTDHADTASDSSARFFQVLAYETLGDSVVVGNLLTAELGRDEASPYIVRAYLDWMRRKTEGEIQLSFGSLSRVLDGRLSQYMACHCTQCGFESNAIFWQCPSCNTWGTVRPYQNHVEYSWLESSD